MTKLMKKSLFLILTLLVLLAVGSVAAYAAITPTQPQQGDGTENNPYQITSAAEFYWFANEVNGGQTDIHAKLMNDITVNENVLSADGDLISDVSGLEIWTPIGSYGDRGDKAYTGTFDGDGHTISGLYINDSDADYVGLFGYVSEFGKIRNVGVKDSYISGNSAVGGVCGYNHSGIIENCYNTGDVSGSSNAGGVCGYNNGGIIEKNCYNTGDVSGDENVGGVCGYNFFAGFITSCYNTGDVSGNNAAGGVCGWNSDGIITNCYNTGSVSGESYVGGVCGGNDDTGTIENCYNTGNVSGNVSGSYVGGVCGLNGGRIENCYNTGYVSGNNNMGGVCGGNVGRTIENCYNTGIVSGTGNNVGGVCGYNESGTIENCYNTGEVSGNNNMGGVCGWNIGGTITNCYFLSRTATEGIGGNSGTVFVNIVEEKENTAFASGEVAWLLNDDQTNKPWRQSINSNMNMPILLNNLPEGVTEGDCKEPVRVTINKSDQTDGAYGYTTAGSALNIILYPYPTGYAFFEDSTYATLINDISKKTYTSDTTIYAAKAVENITLNETELSLYVKDTATLTATVLPPNAYNTQVTWSSSDDTIATVDQNGLVTAVSKGTATITATAADSQGAKATCTVTVKNRSGMVPQKTLTFDTKGGSEIEPLTENYGKTIVLADYTPKRNGYKFVGWYKDKALTEKIEYAILDYDMTVYAKWQKIEETSDYDTLIVLTINDKTSIVNGEAVKNDVAPLIVNSRTYTPARFVAESLGAKVEWNEVSRTVTITKDDVKIILVIDSTTAYVNGTKVQMDASAFIADGRTYTPARFVAEQLGANVEWDEEDRTVTIVK